MKKKGALLAILWLVLSAQSTPHQHQHRTHAADMNDGEEEIIEQGEWTADTDTMTLSDEMDQTDEISDEEEMFEDDGPEADPERPRLVPRMVRADPARLGTIKWQAEIYRSTPFTPEELAFEAGLKPSDARKQFWAQKPDWDNKHRCGGALIKQDWVVTAGHCVTPIAGPGGIFGQRRVRIGTQDISPGGGGATYRIERVVLHKDFKLANLVNDIALIRIVRDPETVLLLRSSVNSIEPTKAPVAFPVQVTATGWGGTLERPVGIPEARAINKGLQRMSPQLRIVKLTVHAPTVCRNRSRFYVEALDQETSICVAANSPKSGDCNGDSGGPLVLKDANGNVTLVGLVSQGRGCGTGMPSLYTNVGHFSGWIDMAIRTSAAGQMVRR